MGMLLKEFIDYIEAERRYSPLTVRNYRRDTEQFLAWLGYDPAQEIDPHEITTEQVRDWIIYRSDTGTSAESINRELSSLRTLFRWLRHKGAVEHDIMCPVRSLKRSQRLPAFVPETRMKEVVAQCYEPTESFTEERNGLMILLFYTCGLRLAELVGINRTDFSDDCTTLRIRGKGDKERIVPIMEFVREKILAHIERIERQNICKIEEKALFLTLKGERISRSVVYYTVKRELALGGVKGKRSPHVLRHTFATHLMNEGADLREIQELMGHASLQSTQVYTHNSIAQLQTIYRKAHPREKGEK